MAGGRKEYELLFQLKAALGGNFNSSFKSAIKTTKDLQNNLSSINSVQSKISGYQKQTDAIKKNKDKLAELNEEQKKLQEQLKNTQAPSDELRKKFENNAKQIKNTTSKIEEQEKRLRDLGDELRDSGINTDKLTQENDKLAKAYNRVKDSQESIARVNQQIEANKAAISETKTELLKTTGVITAVGAAIYAGPVKKAAEFEAQMSKVEAISGATTEEMAALNQKAKEMGASTKFTAVESGKALEYMALAGWKSQQMLDSLEGIMTLAAASGEDLGMVSDIVTDAMTAFGLKAEDSAENVAHFVDVLAATSSNSNTNIAMLGESFKYAAPLAGAFGFSVEDTALMLGLMANSGIKASQSGTSLRRIFATLTSSLVQNDGEIEKNEKKLVKLNEQYKELQEKIKGAKNPSDTLINKFNKTKDEIAGVTAELKELKKGFSIATVNTDGSMRTLKEIIDDVRLAFNGMSEAEIAAAQNNLVDTAKSLSIELSNENGELKTQAELYAEVQDAVDGLTAAGKVQEAENISGKMAMAGLLSIVNSSEEDYNKLADAVYNANGVAEKMQDIMLDNYEGQLVLAKSAVEALQIAVGETLLPTLTEGMKKATDFISSMAKFAQENPQVISTILKVAGGLAAAKVSMLGAKLGFLELKGGALEVQKIFALLKGRIASAAADAATGGSKITELGKSLSGYFGGIKNSLGGLGGSVDKLTGGKLSGIFSKIGSGIQGSILKPLGGLGSKITGVLGGAGSKITGFFGSIGTKITNGPLGKIGGVFGSLGKTIGSVVGGPLKGLGSLFGGLFGKAMPIIMIISALSMLFLKLSGEDISGFIEPLKQAFEDAKPILQSVMEQFKELGKQLLPVLIDTAKKLAPLLGNIIAGILPIILEVIKEIVPLFIQIIGDILPVLLNIICELAPILADVITTVLPVILDLVKMLLPIISQLIKDVLPIIIDVLNTLLPIIKDLIQAVLPVLMSIFEALMPVIEVLASIFSEVLGAALESIGGIIDGVMKTFRGLIDFITGVFTGNWTQAWEGIKGIFGGIFDTLGALIKSPLNVVIGLINGAIKGVNKLGITIPDWVPIIGGKDFKIDIPEIPLLAKGSNDTPDTFIAGEAGAELITNAKGRKVFTAAETGRIFNNINNINGMNGTIQPVSVSVPAVSKFSLSASREPSIVIHNAPTIYIDGGKPSDLEGKLMKNNEQLLNMVKDFLRKKEDDERRMAYV